MQFYYVTLPPGNLPMVSGNPSMTGLFVRNYPNNFADDNRDEDGRKAPPRRGQRIPLQSNSSSAAGSATRLSIADSFVPRFPSNLTDDSHDDDRRRSPPRRGQNIPRKSNGSAAAGAKRRNSSQSRKAVAREESSVVTPLYKTRLCNFHQLGACRNGHTCSFAHGPEDLRPSPDFERTSVCPVMLNNGKCDRPGCRYAHNVEELRTAPGLLKTKMCSFFLRGQCVVGEACRFAHSVEELRESNVVQQAAAACAGTQQSTKTKINNASLIQTNLWELRRNMFRAPTRERASSESTRPRGATDSAVETPNAKGPVKIVNKRVVVKITDEDEDDALPFIRSSTAIPSANESDSDARRNTEEFEQEVAESSNSSNLKIVARNTFITISDRGRKAEETEGSCLRSKSL